MRLSFNPNKFDLPLFFLSLAAIIAHKDALEAVSWITPPPLLMDLKYQQIDILNQRVVLFEERLKVVEPKWYENRYLWFGYGVTLTVGSVILAGQLK